MKTTWTKGLTPEQKAIATSDFLASAGARARLTKLLEDKIASSIAATRSSNKYESPSWALVQADAIGYEKALLEVISLLS